MRTSGLGLVLGWTVLLTAPAGAQAPVPPGEGAAGSLLGTVVGERGEGLPGVEVRLVDEETGRRRTVTTDPTGQFRFTGLEGGSYRVSASAAGFATAEQGGVLIAPARTVRIVLALGGPVPGGEPAGGPVRTGEPARPEPDEPGEPDEPTGDGAGVAPAVAVESRAFGDDLALQAFLSEVAAAGRRLTAIVPLGEGESLFATVPAGGAPVACSAFLDRAPPTAERLRRRLESQPGRVLVGAHRLSADAVALVICDGR